MQSSEQESLELSTISGEGSKKRALSRTITAKVITSDKTATKTSLNVFRMGGALIGMMAGYTSSTNNVRTMQLVMKIGTFLAINLSMLGEI